MKRLFYLPALILMIISASLYAQNSPFSGGGSGSKEDPYRIAQLSDLILVRDHCGGSYTNTHFRLTADITVSATWTPIGNENNKFTGYFHGGGHRISGLKIQERKDNYAGLFGYSEGTIDSLYIGGTTVKGEQYVGGLVGRNAGSIIFCHANVDVDAIKTDGSAFSGGLAGHNTGIIRSSSAKGDVQTSSYVSAYSGGLAGYCSGNSEITDCFATGYVEASAHGASTAYSGGLAGYSGSNATISHCYTAGKPSSMAEQGTTYTGAVIGYNENGKVADCYFNSDIVGNSISGTGFGPGTAEGKSTAGMKLKDIYTGWDFNDIWGINGDYPYLRNQPLRLSNITASHGVLTPAFNPDTLNYTIDIENAVNDINFSATTVSAIVGAEISGTGTHVPVTGRNLFPVTVAHHGGELVYMIAIHRKYTLNFDANGGTVDPASMEILSGTNNLPVPIRYGYEFTEWNAEISGSGESYTDKSVQFAQGISTLYAQWTAQKYTLTFDAAGGSVSPQSMSVTYGAVIGSLPVPTRYGYDFKEWNTVSDGSGNIYTSDTVYMAVHDTTVHAQWTAQKYTLNFDAAGGSVNPQSMTVTYGAVIGSLPDPTRDGYDFKGWNTVSDGSGNIYTKDTVYKAVHDKTVYAQWAKLYTLSFDPRGGDKNPQSIRLTRDASVGILPSPGERKYYTFTGWNISPSGEGNTYTDNAKYNFDKDTSLYAQWKGDSYKLGFDVNYPGGASYEDKVVYYGAPAGQLPNPSRTGYTYIWNTKQDGSGKTYDDQTVYDVNGDMTLFAVWTSKKYTLTFNANGGSVSPASESVSYGTTVVLPTPTLTNYTFTEWNTMLDGTGNTFSGDTPYEIDEDMTVYAQWTGNKHIIVFDAQGGNVSPSETDVSYGSPVGALPDPARSGYTFEGWFTGTGGSGASYSSVDTYMVSGNLTLYAKWTARYDYQLYFNDNYAGAGVTLASKNVTYDIAVGVLETPVRPNYDFVEWNTASDGSGITYDENTIYKVDGHTTLYAKWKGKPYKLSFTVDNKCGAMTLPDKTVYYGDPVGLLPVDICPGHTPVWNTIQDGSGTTYDENTIANGNATLYTSQWNANEYTLSFNAQGGSAELANKSVTYGASVGALPVPVRSGYTFEGWFTGINGTGSKYTDTEVYSVAGNSTVYAFWKGRSGLTLSFDVQGGSASIVDMTVTYGSPVGPLPDPGVRTNYDFIGWNTSAEGNGVTYNNDTPYTINVGDATLYAIWLGTPYTLIFITEGSVNPPSKTVNYGAEVGALPKPSRPGFAFMGWNTQENGAGDTYTDSKKYEKTSNTQLYAQWVDRTYKITFVPNYDGSELEPVSVLENIKYGETVPLPTPNSRDHYIFEGWSTAKDGSGEIHSSSKLYLYDEDIALYAKWKGNPHTLKFDINCPDCHDISNPADKTVAYGSPVGPLPANIRRGYTPEWNTAENGSGTAYTANTTATGDEVLYAQWSVNKYVLHLKAQGGNVAKEYIDVTYDAYVGDLPVPELAGYDFNGWNTAPDGSGTNYDQSTKYKTDDNTSLYAQWTAKEFTLTLVANDGTGSEENRQVKYGSAITLPTPAHTGHTFDHVKGWNTQKDGSGSVFESGDVYEELHNKVLYAQWIANEYTVTFDKNGGGVINPPDPKKVTYGKQIESLPTATRVGYDFTGWKTQAGEGGTLLSATDLYAIPDNTTLYAYWTKKSFTLNFDAGDGTVSPTSQTILYESQAGFLPDPERTGYNFKGWYTGTDGAGESYDANTVHREESDKTVYAKWEIAKYTVTFDINHSEGGVQPSPINANYNSVIENLPLLSDRQGYTFAGWESNGKNHNSAYTVTGNVTLTAQWTPKEFTLNFRTHDNSEIESRTVIYGGVAGELPERTRPGYDFEGWFTAISGGTQYEQETVYTVPGNTSLYERWTARAYNIHFDLNYEGNTAIDGIHVTYGDAVGTLPAITRTGYTFDGWFTEAGGNGERYTPATVFKKTEDISLYAKWEIIEYTITFDSQGGSSVNGYKVKYNSSVGNLPVPDRTGYAFGGWYTGENGSGIKYADNAIYETAGNTALNAAWTANAYTIDFDTQGGNPVSSLQISYNAAAGELPAPTRTGYTFGGWFTEADGKGTGYGSETVYKTVGNTTLYAKWTVKSYTLSFDAQGGAPVPALPANYNDVLSLSAPVRAGYTFKGWNTLKDGSGVAYTENVNYTIDDNITLYAQWEADSYTLSFDTQGGNPVNSQQISYGAVTDALPAVTRAGYTFGGWFTEADGNGTEYTPATVYKTAGNTTLYAKWTVRNYTLGFDAQGGAPVPALPANYNDVLSLSVPVRAGYTFKGWNTLKDGSGVAYTGSINYTADSDITLFAQWEADSYTLNFDTQGGNSVNSQQVSYDAATGALPAVTRAGYTFGGWFTGIGGDGFEYTPATVYKTAGNTTLYAKWTVKSYTIDFDAQGGAPVPALSANYNDILSLSVPVRAGYTFKGWNTLKDGNGIAYTGNVNYTIDGNTTLYAQWEANSCMLDFDAQGGNPVNSLQVTCDAAVGALPAMTRAGYTFGGWFTGIDGDGIEYTPATVYGTAASTTLYAKWTANSYTLEFASNYTGGADPAGRYITYDKPVVTLPTVTRPGYDFKEWNTAEDGSGTKYTVETVFTETDNTTLYAQWTAGIYTVSFEANYRGDIVKPENPPLQNVVYNAATGALPVLTRAGYIFTGWNTAENGSGKSYTEATVYTEADNIILYAQWTGISYTVNFTGNSVSLEPQVVTHGEKIVKPSDPTLQGYAFGGWYKDNDLWDFNSPVTGDILLAAKWISSDAALKSLSVNQGSLSPEFKPLITDYTVIVSYDVTSITTTGLPHHAGAAVTGNDENRPLIVGDNIIKVAVTAEDGVNTQIYTVLVTRKDHILVSDANLISFTANKHPVTITGNTLEYAAACGEQSFEIELQASPYASVAIDGEPYSKGQVIQMTGDVTTVNIHVVSETGIAKDYVLKANASLNQDFLYYRRWDLLGINANPENNGGYIVLAYRWYKYDGSFAGDKGYIQLQSPYSGDYAEIRTEQTEGWRRVCGIPQTLPEEKVAAYPNPAVSGESVKLELPEQYVGGTLNIYDIKGSLVKSGIPLPTSVNSIDMSGFGTGIYLLNITGKDGRRQSVKMIVE
ncbi:MAG: InlB B-repeat-containing protein [Prevotellaceae bacterium]|jgi:uncharacterized repeat protein (TIGR02543 family)|nr:InlB B-repeat-containing protein [Prevotellaceae bacterium]